MGASGRVQAEAHERLGLEITYILRSLILLLYWICEKTYIR